MKFMTSTYMLKVKGLLGLFCQTSKKGKISAVGAEAAQEKLLAAEAKGPALAFEDMEPLHTFSWLLSEADQAKVRDLTSKMVDRVTASSKPARPAGGSKARASVSKAASSSDLGGASAEIMALFA